MIWYLGMRHLPGKMREIVLHIILHMIRVQIILHIRHIRVLII